MISVATNLQQEAYSGLDGTCLADYLEDQNTKTIDIASLATEHREKQTLLDGN